MSRLHSAHITFGLLIAACALGVVACGGDVRPEQRPLCYRGNPAEQAGMTREWQPSEWISLVVNGTAGSTATQDCTGATIQWPTPGEDCPDDEASSDAPFELVILGPDSVVERRLPTGQRLIWIITHVRSDGFALGPIALVDMDDRGTAVRAIGMLRSRYERTRLSMWPVGDGHVLSAEAETCEDPENASSCRRGAQLLARTDDTFRWTPLQEPGGRCIDTAWVEFKRSNEVARDDGWIRTLDYMASVQHDPRYVIVTEQVTIHDRDTRDPQATPRLVRRVDTDRFYHLSAGRLTSRQSPLWPTTLAGWGSMVIQSANTP